MVSRTRTRDSDLQTGMIVYASGSAPQIRERWGKREKCVDTVGDMFDSRGLLKDHPFDMTTTITEGNAVNGTSGESIYARTFVNYVQAIPAYSAITISSAMKEQFRVRLLSSTGPLTPKVNLPLFIFELKDIPMMLRHAGDLLHKIRRPSGLSPHKEAAAATLAYQFGWAPLIGDLKKLVKFTDLVQKRQQELKQASSKKGMKRRMTFDEQTKTEQDDNVLISSISGVIRGSVTKRATTRSWATVRWTPRSGQRTGREPSHNEALRSALGINPGMIPITIWKALPWSWMVDWFADISNVMQATYNMIYYNPAAINFMEERTTEVFTSGGIASNGTSCSSGYEKVVRKLRTQLSSSSAKVTLRLPFMDSFKLSILGSLTILRLSRR